MGLAMLRGSCAKGFGTVAGHACGACLPKGLAQEPKGLAQAPKGLAQVPKGLAQVPKGLATVPRVLARVFVMSGF